MPFFTRLPINTNNPALGVIPAGDIEDLSAYESNAYGHWIFDKGDSSNYVAPLQQQFLTVQGTAPTVGTNYLRVPMSNGNAILTNKNEGASPVDTIAMVFRASVFPSLGIFAGTLNDGTDGAGGGGPFFSTNKIWQNYRGAITSTEVYTGLNTDTWYFLAVSRDFAGASALDMLLGGQSLFTGTNAGTYQTIGNGTDLIGFGNANYASTTSATVDVAEFMLFDYKLTGSELQDLYTRRKSKLAQKGIAVI